jgi:hypothetical protein
MECKQYDDIIFLELPDDKRDEYRKCFTDELNYEGLLVDINFLDKYAMKRLSASYKTTFNFEDVFLKPAKIAFSKTDTDKSMTPLEVDSSKILTTPLAHGLPTAYIQIRNPINEYEQVFFKCRDSDDGDMTLEEYLKELEKIIKNYEQAITQKLTACKDILYALKEQEKNKLQLPYTIVDLKRDYELAQQAYNEERSTYEDMMNTKKLVDKEYTYVVDDKIRLEGELKEAIALLTSLGVKIEPEKKIKLKPSRIAVGDEKFLKDNDSDVDEETEKRDPAVDEAIQTKDPAIEKDMDKPTESGTGYIGAIRSVLSGTWYVLKIAWYGIKTIHYGVRRTWAIAKDIKGFLQDKPAQIQLATLLYNELKAKIRDIDSDVKMLTNEHAQVQKQMADSEKEGLSLATINTLQRNVDITFERLRRFEYVRESIVSSKMSDMFEDMYNTIMNSLDLTMDKEILYVSILAQFPIRFSMENFLTENISALLSEKEIDLDAEALMNTAKQQAKNLYTKSTQSMPKMRPKILQSIGANPMNPVRDCTNQIIIPTFDDYLIAYNQAASQKWSGLIC